VTLSGIYSMDRSSEWCGARPTRRNRPRSRGPMTRDVRRVPDCDLPCTAGVVALEARVEPPARRPDQIRVLDLRDNVIGASIHHQQRARLLGHHIAKWWGGKAADLGLRAPQVTRMSSPSAVAAFITSSMRGRLSAAECVRRGKRFHITLPMILRERRIASLRAPSRRRNDARVIDERELARRPGVATVETRPPLPARCIDEAIIPFNRHSLFQHRSGTPPKNQQLIFI